MLYTTGEIAKLSGVTVRTVQYYDNRGILVPAELSEGGRRLYSEADLEKMKIICFLRDLGLSINSIGDILSDENSYEVILLLLEQQEQQLRAELAERQSKLQKLTELKRWLRNLETVSVETIGDIAHIMENNQKLKKVRAIILTVGILMDIIEVGTVALWIATGIWWPFAVGLPVIIGLGVWISIFYFRKTAYICPACHEVFKPRLRQAFWAPHTPNTRKLTCPVCGRKGFCVETYGEAAEK